ncbi:MAG: putative helicase/exonuclease [Faunusvirus sp.]|uniref:Putative helicase/exonuclease n=1 Tax=Faunusvirus sp. TaxID=2487766 RepID=A0A3G5A032_9VIRU|nr:MAG: putative helicase/exonuclease [Faunusvirus sp.]
MTKILPTPSAEQIAIITGIKDNNIVVDSVAGSGKTTTNLYIALTYPDKNILLLTYNKKLKMETRDKVVDYDISNLDVHSYHSFAVSYYNTACHTDLGILNMLDDVATQLIKPFKYDIIILDETQDISPVYYELVCKIFRNNVSSDSFSAKTRVCVLGDKYQSIYDFNNADPRYIIAAHKLFRFNNDPWCSVKLSTSFRVTIPMAEFVNICMLKETKIHSIKSGSRVRYIMCDVFGKKHSNNTSDTLDCPEGPAERPYAEIKYYIDKGYKYDEIFVLAPSVKSDGCPVRLLANKLSSLNIPVYVPNSDEEKMDEDILKNKIVFSTFHQVKGLERKVVIVFNFDATYFEFYKRDHDVAICPNELYVASTRASEHMSVLHHYENKYLPFLDKAAMKRVCDFERFSKKNKTRRNNNIATNVTDLVRHLPVNVVQRALKYIDVVEVNKAEYKINIPVKTRQNNLYESVSEITGVAIPAYFELKNTGKMSIYPDELLQPAQHDDEIEYEDVVINLKRLHVTELLYIANVWNYLKSGYLYKLRQIKYYNWLKPAKLTKCIDELARYISPGAVFEARLGLENKPELKNRMLTGYIDCIDGNNIWEFKCVQQLEEEHKLQLAIYMYLYERDRIANIDEKIQMLTSDLANTERPAVKQMLTQHIAEQYKLRTCTYNYYLYNILTGQRFNIKSTIDRLSQLIDYLVTVKYCAVKKLTDTEFMSNNCDIYKKYS